MIGRYSYRIRGTDSVHPRWRGEQPSRTAINDGSLDRRFIPAGAGNSFCRFSSIPLRRFIPAGAGNSRPRKREPPSGVSVHPRWRGEQAMTRKTRRVGAPQFRFIPAGAGNSTAAILVPDDKLRPVHPRWRGEQREASRYGRRSRVRNGSSPLARGTAPGLRLKQAGS